MRIEFKIQDLIAISAKRIIPAPNRLPKESFGQELIFQFKFGYRSTGLRNAQDFPLNIRILFVCGFQFPFVCLSAMTVVDKSILRYATIRCCWPPQRLDNRLFNQGILRPVSWHVPAGGQAERNTIHHALQWNPLDRIGVSIYLLSSPTGLRNAPNTLY